MLNSQRKLFKYGYYPITIEYDLIYSRDGYSYLNYLFDENIEDKIIQLAKKPYGVKGTILDEYPNTNNWINILILIPLMIASAIIYEYMLAINWKNMFNFKRKKRSIKN